MPIKIKVFFGVLALVALISVYSLLSSLDISILDNLRGNVSEPFGDLVTDHDHDGLADGDEAFWNTDPDIKDTDGDGFLDGEEVATNRDPTVPAPDDALLGNLTDKVSELAVGGMLDGSLKLESPDFDKNLDSVALAIVDDGINTFSSKIDFSKIITVPNTPESMAEYTESVISVFSSFSEALVSQIKEMDSKLDVIGRGQYENNNFIHFFQQKKIEFDDLGRKWASIPVPEGWKADHINFLTVINGMSEINYALYKTNEDPVKAIMAITYFVNTVEGLSATTENYTTKLGIK